MQRKLTLGLVSALVLSPPVAAQDTAESLRAEIDALKQSLGKLERRLDELQGAAEGESPPSASVAATAESDNVDPSALPARETVADAATAASRPDSEAPPDDPGLRGFFTIPDTQTRVRLGGYAKVDANFDSGAIADRDAFTTSSIDVDGVGDDSGHFNLHARQTRLSIEARRPTARGNLRFYLENDFYGGSGYGYRLRHAYGQLGNTYAGYGFSAFQDPDGAPDTLDFEGPGSAPALFVAAIHYSFRLGEGNSLRISVEDPEAGIGLEDSQRLVESVPDLVVSGRMERGWGHLQLAGAARRLAYAQDGGDSDSTVAGGVSLTGHASLGKRDALVFGANAGSGLARYVSDIGGKQLDAVVAADGQLQAVRSQGVYAGYTHRWRADWRSNLVYGYLSVEREADLLEPDDFRQSQYGALNLIWSPVPSWTMGMELLYGKLRQQDGDEADVMRLQTSLQYNFIR